MNPTLSFLQKHGLKASLPLLLLATACGDSGGTTAFQPDGGSAAGQAIAKAATNTNGFGISPAPSAGLSAPSVTLPTDNGNGSSGPILPPLNTSGSGATSSTPGGGSSSGGGSGAVASVPEPAALAGLAIAAAGMVVIKRKQSAA